MAFDRKLKKAGRDIDFYAVPRAMHVWERFCEKGTPFWEMREEAFRRTERRILAGQTGNAIQ